MSYERFPQPTGSPLWESTVVNKLRGLSREKGKGKGEGEKKFFFALSLYPFPFSHKNAFIE